MHAMSGMSGTNFCVATRSCCVIETVLHFIALRNAECIRLGKSQWENPFQGKGEKKSATTTSKSTLETPENTPTLQDIDTTEAAVAIAIDNDTSKSGGKSNDWVQKFSSAKQKFYYKNSKTGEKSWKKPENA